MTRRSRLLKALTILPVLVTTAHDARAYCRKTTCPECPLDPTTQCPTGPPLVWSRQCLSYALSRAGSMKVSIPEASAAAAEAFRVWQGVSCPGSGRPPSILATAAYGLTGCNMHEYTKNSVNVNVILFHDDEWPHPQSEDAVGLTSTTYDERTGEIFDADIEINSTLELSTADVVATDKYDLLSVLTHEVGHFLGLAHSLDSASTMRSTYDVGTDDFRTLSDDDIQGICAIYPPDRPTQPCNFSPRGGFASECALGVTSGGCNMSSRSGGSAGSAGLTACFSAVLAAALRKSRKSRRPAPHAGPERLD
jgi:hypothetical protein